MATSVSKQNNCFGLHFFATPGSARKTNRNHCFGFLNIINRLTLIFKLITSRYRGKNEVKNFEVMLVDMAWF